MSLYELFIGFRYLKSKKSQGFISFNTLLSVLIVFIGVFILIVVISVMNGFQAQIKDKILDVDSHITIMGYINGGTNEGIKEYKQLTKKIKTIPGVTRAQPYFQGQALFRYKREINPVMIRGIGSKERIPEDIQSFIIEGEKNFSGKPEVLIGSEMALNNRIKKGDYIELIVPKGRFDASLGVLPGLGKFKVKGFFKTGYYDFDTKLILMSLAQAQKLYAVGDKVWGIGIKIDDIYKMGVMASLIQDEIGFSYEAFTAEERNQNLFYALKLEKLIMTIILFLVIISAGFTIMGTLVMVVLEKRKAVGILKSMGAGPHSIMTIFILEGFFIGVAGTIAGVILGLAAAINLEAIIYWIEGLINKVMAYIYKVFELGMYFDISLVPKNVYYIDRIPTEVKPEFVVFIAIFAVFLATVSAIFPAWYASRLNPVDTIRYE